MGLPMNVSHVGMDCHKNFSRATARDATNRILFRERIEHADRKAFRERIKRWPAKTPVILEGSFGWGWISDELADAGLDPHLAHCGKLAAWRKSRGLAKNNRLDADLISELWLEREPWWEVWLAPQAVRDQRELLRWRMGMVRQQSAVKNRIHAILHRHGILHEYSDVFGAAGRKFLELLAEADEPLRQSTRTVLGALLQSLAHLREQIAQATLLLRKNVQQDEQAKIWMTLPGIGWVLAHTIASEIGDIHRFNSRELAKYALLAPLCDDSGDEDPQATPQGRHVGHQGRRTLKWAFIEAAHGAVRKDADLRARWNHYTDNGKRNRNRGYIVVAHELLRRGCSCVKANRRYQTQRPNCSVQGGSDHPMVDAKL